MLIQYTAANVFVQKGYGEEPAVSFRRNDAGEVVIATFGVSGTVFDSKAENNKRYVNFTCKAFGSAAKRIEKMKLGAGSNVNIAGPIDVETWEKDGNKRARAVLVVESIEYNGAGRKNNDAASEGATNAPSGATVDADEEFDDLPF